MRNDMYLFCLLLFHLGQSFRKIDASAGVEQNSNGKRTLPFNGGEQQEKDSKEIVPYTNKKLRSLMTDRQEKADK